MRAVEFNLKDPAFGAELVEIDEPELPNDEWARVAVTVGGICGSDLHLFGNGQMSAPALAEFWTFPFLLGHEIAGRVVETGADACDIRSARALRSTRAPLRGARHRAGVSRLLGRSRRVPSNSAAR